MKKCLQGQIYRSTENDCQGTGTSDDNFGALTLQYCASDDDSCKDTSGTNGIASTELSPASASCASDTTDGKSWILPIVVPEPYPPNPNPPISREILIYMPELPRGETDYFWSALNSYWSDKEATVFSFQSDLSVASDFKPKSSTQFVLCVTEKVQTE